MNRLAGIVVAVIGLIVAVLGALKIVPGLTQPGVMLILLGGLIIGLSFVDGPETDDTPRMSTASTLGNIFFSPAEVFRNLRRHPRWLVVVLVMSVLSAVYGNLFMQRLGAERIANFAIDKTLELPIMNDQAKAEVEKSRPQAIADAQNPLIRVGQAVSGFAGTVFLTAFLALVFFLFALAMGGKLNYWQAFSVAAYAAFPVAVIRFVLNTILLYVKDPIDIHPITGQSSLIQDNLNFLFSPKEHPVLYTIAGVFSILMFYWIWLNAIGLKNGGERVSGSTAWTASIAIFVAILCLASVMALLFPGFIS
jgi:hypothetical protein